MTLFQKWNEWCRIHHKQLWTCFIGLAAFEVVAGVVVWFYSHSTHPVYPDSRAAYAFAAFVAICVLFFIAWPLICFRSKKN